VTGVRLSRVYQIQPATDSGRRVASIYRSISVNKLKAVWHNLSTSTPFRYVSSYLHMRMPFHVVVVWTNDPELIVQHSI
jgi:hypothetical protein